MSTVAANKASQTLQAWLAQPLAEKLKTSVPTIKTQEDANLASARLRKFESNIVSLENKKNKTAADDARSDKLHKLFKKLSNAVKGWFGGVSVANTPSVAPNTNTPANTTEPNSSIINPESPAKSQGTNAVQGANLANSLDASERRLTELYNAEGGNVDHAAIAREQANYQKLSRSFEMFQTLLKNSHERMMRVIQNLRMQ